jgi:hypothetical protein
LTLPVSLFRSESRFESSDLELTKYLRARLGEIWTSVSPDDRFRLLNTAVSPILQRELAHKGAEKGHGGYSAELVAYVEVV